MTAPANSLINSVDKNLAAVRAASNVDFFSGQISQIRNGDPCSCALAYANRQLSYAEFNRAADRFAGYLERLGVGPGNIVAICMERSFDWIIAALGIMRVGAGYVALDPGWPDFRLRFAVEDSGATVLVARSALFDRLSVRARGIDPGRDAAEIASTPELVGGPIQPDSLAYVIYTSGSTGVPKGVEITHANLDNLIQWHRDAFHVTAQDRASHLAGLGFDAAAWEIWPYLCAGATVCLADDVARSSPEQLQQWLIDERITIGFVPTVFAGTMITREWPATTSLRALLTGGDTLLRGPVSGLPFDVVNNYGPAECTVVATSCVVKPGLAGPPSIGRPIAGTSIYLLNEKGEQVADGAVGEICIGGLGVGRRYRNLPELTERSFLPDPFSGTPSARIYRTGDRGVRLPSGEIEFRGRLDRQIKVQGQRVELDEIGSALSLHPGIAFAMAISKISAREENQIVTYLLLEKDAPLPTALELQSFLSRSLPKYMIPSLFLRLREFPFSANGKLDISTLQRGSAEPLPQGYGCKPLAGSTERRLLTVVRNLLKNDAISPSESFFLAGGHSLLGMQLVLQIRNEFGVDLSLRQLFEAVTVERLALLIESRHADASVSSSGKNVREASNDEMPIAVTEAYRNLAAHRASSTQAEVKREASLPAGVLAPRARDDRNCLFWIQSPRVDLARVIGDSYPLSPVMLTSEDLTSLGETPTLRSIAACLSRKITTVQPEGPLDAPNPSHMEYCDSLGRKAKYFKYLLGRAARLGPRTSFTLLRQRLSNRFRNAIPDAFKGLEGTALRRLEAAALAYRPGRYDGRVLLLLGADHPPHVDLLSGWQDVIGQGLNARYMDAYHLDFMRIEKIPAIADAILADLSALNGASSRSCQQTALETCGGRPAFQQKSALSEAHGQRHSSE